MEEVCPKCGDAGTWLDDDGWHYCDCKIGLAAEEEDRGSD